MIITGIFLITCIVTARVLEEKKMRIASVIYSILSVILIDALLLTSDLAPVKYIFKTLMGEECYLYIKSAIFDTLYTTGYGSCILFAFFTTLFIQVVISFIYVITNIVKLSKIYEVSYIPEKNNYRCLHIYQTLCLKKNINLLYCRMLN